MALFLIYWCHIRKNALKMFSEWWVLVQVEITNTSLGPFHIKSVRTLAYYDPQCSRSLKLSQRLYLESDWTAHIHDQPPAHAWFTPQPAFMLLSVKASLYRISFAYISVQDCSCWPCWLHYQSVGQNEIMEKKNICLHAREDTTQRRKITTVW